ncbi:zinc-binding dehydrogenase [Aliirhizobium terrae]|uniref:zinc-binding dehydrogenase n=1 Tax=Terrirhizobium terrae TaxID=2926709 RepID=UPI0035B52066
MKTVPKGVIYLYGALGGETATIPVLEALMHRATIKAWIIADLLADDNRKRKAIKYVSDALRRKDITPIIDSVFTFEDMVAAHRHLESGQQFGKVIVTLGVPARDNAVSPLNGFSGKRSGNIITPLTRSSVSIWRVAGERL